MIVFLLVFLGTSLLWAEASSPEGSLMGLTNDQLKAEIYRQRRQIRELRTKLGLTDTLEIKNEKSVQFPEGSWKVDDFENAAPASGFGWWSAGYDNNDMGTTLAPSPYQRLEMGSPLSPGYCAGMKGHLGPNEAPWSWAYLETSLSEEEKPVDLNRYSAVWFTAKGDGKYYVLTLRRAAVKDGCNYQADFLATDKWTLIKIPLNRFTQPGWGTQVPRTFLDVRSMAFSPELHEADFDLKVDDIVFVK